MPDPSLPPLPAEDWPERLAHVIRDMRGKPINVHGLMAHHPPLLEAWWNFRNYVVTGGALEQRDCELVILAVAQHVQNWYEWASHVDRGLSSGITAEEIDWIRSGNGQWSAKDASLLEIVDELLERYSISPSLLARARSFFSTGQVMDVIAIHGAYVILGCMLNTWETPLDASVAARLPPGTTL